MKFILIVLFSLNVFAQTKVPVETGTDYTFGSVSVTVAATGTSGTPTYTTSWGSYQKNGRRVSLDAYVNVASWAGSPTGNLRFGLPVISGNINSNYRGICKVGYMDNMNFPIVGMAAGVISNNSPYMDLYIVPSSGTTTTAVPVDTAFLIMFSCDYFTN